MILGIGDIVEELLDFHVIGPITAHQTLLVVCMVFTCGLFYWAARRLPDAPRKTGVLALLEFGLVWTRDEIAYAFMGPELGRKYLYLIWTLFFFILFSNVFGLFPYPVYMHHKTDAFVVATGNLAVTTALALVVFLVTQTAGMMKHGPIKYFGTLIPPGVPKVIIPLLFLMEFFGLFTKPLALLIRLFANMIAGHALFAVLFGILIGIGAFGVGSGAFAMTVVGTLGIIGVYLLEVLIALLQAYIFAALAATYISMAVNPAH